MIHANTCRLIPKSNNYICVCVYHLNRCKTSYWFSLLCRGTGADLPIQSNEAMAFRWMSGLINHLCLQNSVWTVDQAVTLRCFDSTRLPQSVLHASEPSSDFRRNHIADSIMIFWHIFAEIMSPTNFGSFWETIAETIFWISTCWSKLYGIWLRLRLTISDALHRFREVPHVALLFI